LRHDPPQPWALATIGAGLVPIPGEAQRSEQRRDLVVMLALDPVLPDAARADQRLIAGELRRG
jgi:hypothetical protein